MPAWSIKFTYHIVLMGIIGALPLVILPFDMPQIFEQILLINMVIIAPFYFLNIFYLVPSLLQKRRYLFYLLGLVACVFAVGLLRYLVLGEVQLHFDEVEKPFFLPPNMQKVSYPSFGISFPMIMLITVGTAVEMMLDWEKQKREREKIEKEKIATELMFLKSQINPHFLFNTLNSIYSLTLNRSQLASEAILILSDLMRYMIYEAKVEKIALSREIEYLENYISLQKLRISRKKNVYIRFVVLGTVNSQLIAPMLLVTFVENAFKHGISYKEESYVHITVEILNGQLVLHVSNSQRSKENRNGQDLEHSGIGIANLSRRLDLIYPDKYKLDTQNNAESYNVKLELTL